jgi:uncharacterized CHY-type Zn-finger protein
LTKIKVLGIDLDSNYRCKHYNAIEDVVAIKMACCKTYYACIECHNELAQHKSLKWERSEQSALAVLCGKCNGEFSIQTYLSSSESCPICKAAFNSKCKNHHPLYFKIK